MVDHLDQDGSVAVLVAPRDLERIFGSESEDLGVNAEAGQV